MSTERFAAHSASTDPGRHAALLREPRGIEQISWTVSNLVLHYRAEAALLRPDRRDEINSRWVATVLDLDQRRNPGSVLAPRPQGERVAGCCRDHSLLAVAMLREQGIPARTRVGFADYFVPDWHADHVVAEWWTGNRWQRFDPELEPGTRDFAIRDLDRGEGAPFETGAEVWRGHRAGRLDADRYGVAPDSGLTGPDFVRFYVIMDLNHRYGSELLLWDLIGEGVSDEKTDELAELATRADAGDRAAEDELEARFRADDRLHPGRTITQLSPYGEPPVTVDLSRRPDPVGEPAASS